MEQKIYDEERTRVLNEIGFTVIRFNNDEVLNSIEKIPISIILFNMPKITKIIKPKNIFSHSSHNVLKINTLYNS